MAINLKDYPEFMTVGQFAEALQVCEGTVRRWIKEGIVKTWQAGPRVKGKNGKALRIPREELSGGGYEPEGYKGGDANEGEKEGLR